MFELGILALGRALEEGAFRSGWELRGIGTAAKARSIDLGGDVELELLPRAAQRDYAAILAEHDVGLALMYTPHPSLVPIEMASAGLLTVTNTFENKTAEALAAISTNLIAAEPTVEGIAARAARGGGRRRGRRAARRGQPGELGPGLGRVLRRRAARSRARLARSARPDAVAVTPAAHGIGSATRGAARRRDRARLLLGRVLQRRRARWPAWWPGVSWSLALIAAPRKPSRRSRRAAGAGRPRRRSRRGRCSRSCGRRSPATRTAQGQIAFLYLGALVAAFAPPARPR